MPTTHRAIIVADLNAHPGTDNLNTLLSQGWTPIMMCPMASSGGAEQGPMSVIHPTCLVIVKAPAGYQEGDEALPRDEDGYSPLRPDPKDDTDTGAPPKGGKTPGKPSKPASKLTKALKPKAKR